MHPQETVDRARYLSAQGRVPGTDRRTDCPRCYGTRLNEPAYAYLFGLYLGDGCLTRGRRQVFALCIQCSEDWPGLLDAAKSAMAAVMPMSSVFSVKRQGCTEVKSTSKHWPCLFPQHGSGRKHDRTIELASWQQAIADRFPGQFARGCSIPTAGAG